MATLTIHHGASTPVRARGVHQCKLLAFAERYPGWHTYQQDRATKRAVAALQNRDCLEVVGDQFRFTYPKG